MLALRAGSYLLFLRIVVSGGSLGALAGCLEGPLDATLEPRSQFSAPPAETPSGRKLALRGVDRASASARQLVVQLARAPSARLRRQLTDAGFRELAYLSSNALVLERRAGSVSALAALADVIGVEPYRPRDRVSRELARETVGTQGSDEVPLLIHVLPEHDTTAIEAQLAVHGLSVLASGTAGAFPRISTLVPRHAAAALAEQLGSLSDVFFVERIHHLGFFNDRSAGSVQSGSQGTSAMVTPIWAHGLRGQGQVLGLIDSGLDVDSCFFADSTPGKLPKTNTWSKAGGYEKEVDLSHRKVIAYDFLYSCDQWAGARGCEMPSVNTLWDDHGHGTHCSGSMVGNRAGAKNNGIAPEARIVVQDGGTTTNSCSEMPGLGCPVIDLYPIFEQAYLQGVRVHNNSYGDNEEAPAPRQSNYTARSQDVDRFMWEHKDMLIVFAAGNSGARNTDFSVGSPSTNKNGLAVGSARTSATATSDDDLSSFSSRGWSADGRIKPDIVAPGCNVSAGSDLRIGTNNCAEDTGCGTSYAAPVAVGAAALVRQYFSEGFYPSGAKQAADALVPSAALIKAVLLNGAVSMGGRDNRGQAIDPIPSHEQGWGRIQLDRALLFQGAARKLYVDDHKVGFAAGAVASVRYELRGVNAAEPLKITLAWTDYPGSPDSPPAAPSVTNVAALNAPRLVNDLDLSVSSGGQTFLGNAFTAGKSSAGGAPDRRNNVEQLILSASGDVTVTVKTANIAQAGQDFALVITGRWERIDGDDPMEPPPTSLDAGNVSETPARADASAGGSDAGSNTQTGVPNPVLVGPGSDASAQSPAVTSPDAAASGDASAPRKASGGDCGVGTSSGGAGHFVLLALALMLRAVRRRQPRR